MSSYPCTAVLLPWWRFGGQQLHLTMHGRASLGTQMCGTFGTGCSFEDPKMRGRASWWKDAGLTSGQQGALGQVRQPKRATTNKIIQTTKKSCKFAKPSAISRSISHSWKDRLIFLMHSDPAASQKEHTRDFRKLVCPRPRRALYWIICVKLLYRQLLPGAEFVCFLGL